MSRRRIAFIHGFTQTSQSWANAAHLVGEALDPRPEIVLLDAPGHGTLADVHADLVDGADLLAARAGQATYVGYSMGGRLALHVALQHPELVERLVLIGATPGIADADERHARLAADHERAAHLERVGVARFLTEWLAQPIFASLPADAAGVEQRLANTATGLAASLRLAGTGAQAWLGDRLGELTMPVLVLAGQLDDKFTAIGRAMAAAIPSATFASVEGAGHSVHLEQPDRTAAAIAGWLADVQEPMTAPAENSTP